MILASFELDFGRHGHCTAEVLGTRGPQGSLDDLIVRDAHGDVVPSHTLRAWLEDLGADEDDVDDFLWRLAADALEWNSLDLRTDRYDVARGAWIGPVLQ